MTDPALSAATPSLAGAGFGPLLALAAVALAIPLLLWLLKRSPWGTRLGGVAPGARPPARLLASLTVGPQHRVLTLEVGEGAQRRWLLVGLTPQGLNTLHTLEAPPPEALAALPEAASAAPTPPGFAALLAGWRGRA